MHEKRITLAGAVGKARDAQFTAERDLATLEALADVLGADLPMTIASRVSSPALVPPRIWITTDVPSLIDPETGDPAGEIRRTLFALANTPGPELLPMGIGKAGCVSTEPVRWMDEKYREGLTYEGSPYLFRFEASGSGRDTHASAAQLLFAADIPIAKHESVQALFRFRVQPYPCGSADMQAELHRLGVTFEREATAWNHHGTATAWRSVWRMCEAFRERFTPQAYAGGHLYAIAETGTEVEDILSLGGDGSVFQ